MLPRFYILCLSLLLPGWQAGAEPLTLAAALQRAEEIAPALKEAKAKATAIAAESRQEIAWPNPSLEFESESLGSDEGSEHRVLVHQPILLPSWRSATTHFAQSAQKAAMGEVLIKRLELRADVRRAFGRVLAETAQREVAAQAMLRAEQAMHAAAELVKAGSVPAIEADRARSRQAAAAAAHRQAEAALRAAQRDLLRLCGSAEITGQLDRPEVPALEGDIPRHHPHLRQAEVEYELARARLKAARSARWQSIDLSAGMQQFENGDSAATVAISTEIPLWDRRHPEVEARQADLERSEAALEQSRIESSHRLATARDNWETAQVSLKALDEVELPLARSVAEAASRSYQSGATGFLDMLDAQDRLAEAESKRISSLLASWDAAAELNKWLEPLSPETPE